MFCCSDVCREEAYRRLDGLIESLTDRIEDRRSRHGQVGESCLNMRDQTIPNLSDSVIMDA